MNEEDLLGVRNFGEKSLQELRERLLARNFLRIHAPAPSELIWTRYNGGMS